MYNICDLRVLIWSCKLIYNSCTLDTRPVGPRYIRSFTVQAKFGGIIYRFPNRKRRTRFAIELLETIGSLISFKNARLKFSSQRISSVDHQVFYAIRNDSRRCISTARIPAPEILGLLNGKRQVYICCHPRSCFNRLFERDVCERTDRLIAG